MPTQPSTTATVLGRGIGMLAWADVTLVMSRMTIAKTATGHPPPGHRWIEMDGTSRAMTQTGPAFASSEPEFAT